MHPRMRRPAMNVRFVTLFVALIGVNVAMAAAPASEPIEPIHPAVAGNRALAELGKKLYFDPRLSKSGFISCNSCHNLSMGGSDNLRTSIGHNWQKGPINAPTVLLSGTPTLRIALCTLTTSPPHIQRMVSTAWMPSSIRRSRRSR